MATQNPTDTVLAEVTPDCLIELERYSLSREQDGVVVGEEDGYRVLIDGEPVVTFPDYGALGVNYHAVAQRYVRMLRDKRAALR